MSRPRRRAATWRSGAVDSRRSRSMARLPAVVVIHTHRGFGWHTPDGPLLGGDGENARPPVLGQVDVRRGRGSGWRGAATDLTPKDLGRGQPCVGRTSMGRSQATDALAAQSRAASRSGASRPRSRPSAPWSRRSRGTVTRCRRLRRARRSTTTRPQPAWKHPGAGLLHLGRELVGLRHLALDLGCGEVGVVVVLVEADGQQVPGHGHSLLGVNGRRAPDAPLVTSTNATGRIDTRPARNFLWPACRNRRVRS